MTDESEDKAKPPPSADAQRERRRAWREANRERLARQAREYRERNRDALAASAKAYRERNKEAIREKAKFYRERDKEKRREYLRVYNETHRDRKNELARESARRVADRKRAEAEQREARRAYAREWYAAHREEYLAYQREARKRQKEADPDGYLATRRAANKRWRDNNRDVQNEKARDRYRADRRPTLEARASYYAAHAEEITARKRARYAADRDAQLAKQRRWREREARRRAAGLPARALHRVSAAERNANQSNADAYFARVYTAEQIAEISVTPDRLISRWDRDSERARVASYYALGPDVSRPSIRAEVRRAEAERDRVEREAAVRADLDLEDARLDAIARAINDTLRRPAPRGDVRQDDSAPVHARAALDRTGPRL